MGDDSHKGTEYIAGGLLGWALREGSSVGKARAFTWREEQHKQAGSGEVRGAYGECQRAVAGVEASERGAVADTSEAGW